MKINKTDIGSDILDALVHGEHKARTIEDISKETNIEIKEILYWMYCNQDKMIRLSRRDADGNSLYTTVEHYNSTASGFEKVISMIINGWY